MNVATHRDIRRIFPGIQDHAVSEILGMSASVDELDAALVLLASEDTELIEIKRREGDRIHRLMTILSQADIQPADDRD